MSYSYIYSYTLKLYTAVLQYSLASYIAIAIVTIGVSDDACIPCAGGIAIPTYELAAYIDFEIWSICLLENLVKISESRLWPVSIPRSVGAHVIHK